MPFFTLVAAIILLSSHGVEAKASDINGSEAVAFNPMPRKLKRSQDASEHYCIVTHDSAPRRSFVAVAERSQRHYAERHGYSHDSYSGHISGEFFLDPSRGDAGTLRGGGLYWQKLTAVAYLLAEGTTNAFGRTERCDWVVWMDSDLVITNESIRLEDIVSTYAEKPKADHLDSVDVMLVPDDRHPVSGGMFFIRNTAIGRSFIDSVAALYPAYKDNFLPEQSAMATVAYMVEPWPCNGRVPGPKAVLHPSVVVLPHRAINSFPDHGRNQAAHVVWQPCDFVAHFAGVRASEREAAMVDVLQGIKACEGRDDIFEP